MLSNRDDFEDLEPLMSTKERVLAGERSTITKMSSPKQKPGNETTDIIKNKKIQRNNS